VLRAVEVDEPQVRSPLLSRAQLRVVHWVRPELVADVAFTEWTRDGTLRHPIFSGVNSLAL
jgi:ATP-dependent DNA ligase